LFVHSSDVLFFVVSLLKYSDVNRAVNAAKRAFPHWSTTPATERANYLLAIAKEIEANQDEIARMEVLTSLLTFYFSLLTTYDCLSPNLTLS
jgi:acyl-CoA reductase-like NAD-dependent aldehyde dehydrogenase